MSSQVIAFRNLWTLSADVITPPYTVSYRKSPEVPYASLVIASQSCKLESCRIFFLGQCMGQFLIISIQVENWNGSFVYGSSSPISLLFSHHITGLPTKFMCKVYKVGLGLRLNQLVLDCVAYIHIPN